jgi:hypothetical protein
LESQKIPRDFFLRRTGPSTNFKIRNGAQMMGALAVLAALQTKGWPLALALDPAVR